jgi:hypothetical protein
MMNASVVAWAVWKMSGMAVQFYSEPLLLKLEIKKDNRLIS